LAFGAPNCISHVALSAEQHEQSGLGSGLRVCVCIENQFWQNNLQQHDCWQKGLCCLSASVCFLCSAECFISEAQHWVSCKRLPFEINGLKYNTAAIQWRNWIRHTDIKMAFSVLNRLSDYWKGMRSGEILVSCEQKNCQQGNEIGSRRKIYSVWWAKFISVC